MQKTDRVCNSVCAFGAIAVVALMPIACHQAKAAPGTDPVTTATAPDEVVTGHAFGDTLRHRIQVRSLDRSTEIADVIMQRPENVIVLAVEPGRDIEVIFPSPGSGRKQKVTSKEYRFLMQRTELVAKSNAASNASDGRRAYENCMRTRALMIRQATKRVVRDSSGRIISGGDDPPVQREPPTCDALSSVPLTGEWQKTVLPPRPERERYLVVLTSSGKIEGLDLMLRMEGLSTTASDVALTIEAIAAGIFVGVSDSYGGTWVNW